MAIAFIVLFARLFACNGGAPLPDERYLLDSKRFGGIQIVTVNENV